MINLQRIFHFFAGNISNSTTRLDSYVLAQVRRRLVSTAGGSFILGSAKRLVYCQMLRAPFIGRFFTSF